MNKMRFEQDNRKKKKDNLGFYVALGLCICAVGAVGWGVFGSGDDNNINQSSTIITASQTEESTTEAANNLIESEPTLSQAEPTQSTNTVSSQPTVSESVKQQTQETAEVFEDDMGARQVTANAGSKGNEIFTLPVTGKLLKGFSGEDLVFCETMDDWRVHDGIDIAADKGTKVKTAAAGKIVDVYTDDLYNTTVVICHYDRLTVYYCGLSETVTVKKGQAIEAGTVIGAVKGIPCECAIESHIHLSAKENGAYVDPVTAMSFKFEK